MATISKKLAEELVEKVKKQKAPKYYCIVKYWNELNQATDYAYCKGRLQYEAVLNSPVVSNVEVLWSSKRFQNDHAPQGTRRKETRQQALARSMRDLIDNL